MVYLPTRVKDLLAVLLDLASYLGSGLAQLGSVVLRYGESELLVRFQLMAVAITCGSQGTDKILLFAEHLGEVETKLHHPSIEQGCPGMLQSLDGLVNLVTAEGDIDLGPTLGCCALRCKTPLIPSDTGG